MSTAANMLGVAISSLDTGGISNQISSGEWSDFCEKQAKIAAADFAKAFCSYVNLDLSENARANLSYRDFLRKFVETFCDHFEAEYLRLSAK